MNFSWWTFALQAANFLILVWLLQRFLFKPVKAIVARRKEEISRALNEASQQQAAAEKLKREFEGARSAIADERLKMIDEQRALFDAERGKIVDEARREAKKITDQAIKSLDEEKAQAREELIHGTIELAAGIAERLLREIAVSSLERPFLGRVIDHLDRMPAEERARLLPRNGASTVLVITAHPLDTQEQAAWHEQLTKKLGVDLTIGFDADPALIAGTVVTFPHAILNFNWRDSMALALKELYGNRQPR